jgi:hypothetical protein
MAKQLATEMAPPFNLVAHYMIAGAFFYMLTSFILPFYADELGGYFVSGTIASLSHLYLLGFVMMIIFGAMYQLVPVILEIPLFSKDFAYIQFYLYVVGLSLMSYAFAHESMLFLLPYGSLLVYISMLIFTVNIFLTYRNIEEWSISAKYIFVSNIFLFIAVTFGLIAAFNLFYGFLETDMLRIVGAHMAGVLVGYVMMTVMGVSMILIPMFSLSHGFDERPIKTGFYFITAGVVLFTIGSLMESFALEIAGVAAMVISLVLFAWQMWIIFTKRIRKQNDFWAKNMIASFLFFLLSIAVFALSYLIKWENLALFAGYLFFFGFLATIIIGHIYKILPFLVWYQRYSPLVGKQKVPMLNDMVVEKVADWQFWITLAGTVVSSLGVLFASQILFIAGTVVMALSAFLVLYNIYYTLSYRK